MVKAGSLVVLQISATLQEKLFDEHGFVLNGLAMELLTNDMDNFGMRKFKSAYDFYRLPDLERRSMVGQQFFEVGRDTEYFVISMDDPACNYGVFQGVIFLLPIQPNRYKVSEFGDKWFRVGVFSPDDEDKDLDFFGDDCKHFKKVRKFLREMNPLFLNVGYNEILSMVQEHVQAGIRTS